MQCYPVFLRLSGKHVVVAGAGRAAAAKLRLLVRTGARIRVFGPDPAAEVLAWHREGALRHVGRPVEGGDLAGAALQYCASGDRAEDARAAALGRGRGVLVGMVDDLGGSDFITPAIVDRDPVTVAIGTGGAAPVLARQLRAAIESRLPGSLGALARIGQGFRSEVERLPAGRPRRAFWSEYFTRRGPRSFARNGERGARDSLRGLLEETLAGAPPPGWVSLVGAGPGDPELLAIRARNRLQEADVVVHDRLVAPRILDLARREADRVHAGKKGYGPSWPQEAINELLIREARAGRHVVRLKSGDPGVFGRLDEEIDALEAAGVPWEVVPGITAASSAAADMGASLTRRGRNSELRILTGRDVDGLAEQDWASLARPGAVAAVYMAKRAAAFLRGRLLMCGAAPSTPVTIVENASLPGRRVVATDLLRLPGALDEGTFPGPVVLMLGVAPRGVAEAGVRGGARSLSAEREAV